MTHSKPHHCFFFFPISSCSQSLKPLLSSCSTIFYSPPAQPSSTLLLLNHPIQVISPTHRGLRTLFCRLSPLYDLDVLLSFSPSSTSTQRRKKVGALEEDLRSMAGKLGGGEAQGGARGGGGVAGLARTRGKIARSAAIVCCFTPWGGLDLRVLCWD